MQTQDPDLPLLEETAAHDADLFAVAQAGASLYSAVDGLLRSPAAAGLPPDIVSALTAQSEAWRQATATARANGEARAHAALAAKT